MVKAKAKRGQRGIPLPALRYVREGQGLTMRELEEKSRADDGRPVHQQTISLLERGQRAASVRTARRLAELLGVTIDDLREIPEVAEIED